MLVLSRMREESIVVSDSGGGCVLTVLHVRGGEVSLLVSHSSVEKPGALNTWTTKLVRDASFKVGSTAEVTLVDVREEKARIGINAGKSPSVHRLEVWEAIKREQRGASGGDAETVRQAHRYHVRTVRSRRRSTSGWMSLLRRAAVGE